MKWVFFLLLLFLVVALLGALTILEPGNVTITWLNYEIQFSVVGFFVLFIFLFFLIFTFSKMMSCLLHFIDRIYPFSRKLKNKKENIQDVPPS